MRTDGNNQKKKTCLIELVAKMPRQFGLNPKVANLLNVNSLKPIRGGVYNPNIIAQVVHKDFDDPNVEPAIIQIAEDFWGAPVEEIIPGFVRKFPPKTFSQPTPQPA